MHFPSASLADARSQASVTLSEPARTHTGIALSGASTATSRPVHPPARPRLDPVAAGSAAARSRAPSSKDRRDRQQRPVAVGDHPVRDCVGIRSVLHAVVCALLSARSAFRRRSVPRTAAFTIDRPPPAPPAADAMPSAFRPVVADCPLVSSRASTRADRPATAERATSAFSIERLHRRPRPDGSYWCISTASANRRGPLRRAPLNARRAAAFDSIRRCSSLAQSRGRSGRADPTSSAGLTSDAARRRA
jgi:hypothetical protein